LLAEAHKVVKAVTTVLADKIETNEMMQVVDEQERKTTQCQDKATKLQDKWKKIVHDAKDDAEKLRQEAIRPR
jgi:acid phosphatase class B